MTETDAERIDQDYKLIADELARFAEAIDRAMTHADLDRHASSAIADASRLASHDDLLRAARARNGDDGGWFVTEPVDF